MNALPSIANGPYKREQTTTVHEPAKFPRKLNYFENRKKEIDRKMIERSLEGASEAVKEKHRLRTEKKAEKI